MPEVELDGGLARRFEAAARVALPAEALGLLLGRIEGARLVIRDLVLVANVAAEPEAAFALAAPDWRRVRIAAGERGLEIVGLVHSHPDGPDRLSEQDVAAQARLFAEGPSWPLLVCARRGEAVWSWSAWRLEDRRPARLALVLT